MSQKMERFTQRARRVLTNAQEAAVRFGHQEIGTEHLLIALFQEESGVSGQVLRTLGLDQRRLEELTERLTRRSSDFGNRPQELLLHTKKTLELAVDEARRMGHHYIGTEHLLLGLVRMSEGMAIEVLKRFGIAPEEVRQQTRKALQESLTQTSSGVQSTIVDETPPSKRQPRVFRLGLEVSDDVGNLLLVYDKIAQAQGANEIELPHLLSALLQEHQQKIVTLLSQSLSRSESPQTDDNDDPEA